MIFDTTVNGIPCQCKVLDYQPYLPMRITGTGYGDAIAPEDECFEFELLDRKGYRAKWLDRYINPAVESRLLNEFSRLRQDAVMLKKMATRPLEDIPF